jgi:hypothetical protein
MSFFICPISHSLLLDSLPTYLLTYLLPYLATYIHTHIFLTFFVFPFRYEQHGAGGVRTTTNEGRVLLALFFPLCAFSQIERHTLLRGGCTCIDYFWMGSCMFLGFEEEGGEGSWKDGGIRDGMGGGWVSVYTS